MCRRPGRTRLKHKRQSRGRGRALLGDRRTLAQPRCKRSIGRGQAHVRQTGDSLHALRVAPVQDEANTRMLVQDALHCVEART